MIFSLAAIAIFVLFGGFSVANMLFNAEFEESIVISPVMGFLLLTLAVPLLRIFPLLIYPMSIVAIFSSWRLSTVEVSRSEAKGLAYAVIPHILGVLLSIYYRPLVASWINPDEPFHFLASINYAENGKVIHTYPFLIHLAGGAIKSVVDYDGWVFAFRLILSSLIPVEAGLVYMIIREIYGERIALLSAWSLLPISSGIRHLFDVGTYANLVCDVISLFLVYSLLKRKLVWCVLIGALLPLAHISSWYLLVFLLIVALRKKKLFFALPLVSAFITTLLIPGVIFELVTYIREELSISSINLNPLGVIYSLLSLIKKMELDLGLWVAIPLSGLILLRFKDECEKWLLLYTLGYLTLAYLSFAQITIIGFSIRFVLQLSLPFSVISALSLRKILSLLRLSNMAPIALIIVIAWFLTNPVIREDQWAIWNDMRRFRDLASGKKVVLLGFMGVTNYLEVVGCNVVGKVAQPWDSSLREGAHLIAVSLDMPPEYRLTLPCFVEAFRTSRFVAYQPVVGCEPPVFEIISCQLNPLKVKLVCKEQSAPLEVVLDPKNWVVYVGGTPCDVLGVESLSSRDKTIGPGDEIILEISCREEKMPIEIVIHGPGGSVVRKNILCSNG